LAVVAVALLAVVIGLVIVPAIHRRAQSRQPTRTAQPARPLPNRTAPPATEPLPPPAEWGEPYPIRVDAGFAAPGTMVRREAEEKLLLLEEQIGREPQNAALHMERGNVLFLIERYADAAAAYEQAYGLTAALPWAHYNRGVALVYLRQPEAALAEFQWTHDAVGGKPEACVFFNLALTHSILEHREPAVLALREFLRLAAGDDTWRRRAVEMLRRWGEEP
jgi:tetratricopeptide (TPR) repeat protein